MNRRDFLKYVPVLAGGAVISRPPSLLSGTAPSLSVDHASLHLVTDDADQALPMLDGILKSPGLWGGPVKFLEYPLAGTHVADLVMIRNQVLSDYRVADDELSRWLREISGALRMPRTVRNPVFMKFDAAQSATTPTTVNVFQNNILVERLAIDAAREAYKLDGDKGSVTIAVKNRRVRVIAATCKHKTCMSMNSIQAPGQHLVCIPNQLRISLDGHQTGDVDGVSF